jgi:hypothetical protein
MDLVEFGVGVPGGGGSKNWRCASDLFQKNDVELNTRIFHAIAKVSTSAYEAFDTGQHGKDIVKDRQIAEAKKHAY